MQVLIGVLQNASMCERRHLLDISKSSISLNVLTVQQFKLPNTEKTYLIIQLKYFQVFTTSLI